MDPELRTLLKALLDGQVNLAEGLTRFASDTNKAIAQLAEGQVKLAEGQVRVGERVGQLVTAQLRTEEELRRLAADTREAIGLLAADTKEAINRLTERLDRMAVQMTRGFTDGAERQGKQGQRLDKLEARVDKLEHAQP